MSGLTLILLGSGKTDKHTYYVLNSIYENIQETNKFRINGPPAIDITTVKGNVQTAITEICKKNPQEVHIIGHSRGAIEGVIIANELDQYNKKGKVNYEFNLNGKQLNTNKVNLLLYDPVSRTEAPGDKYTVGPLVKRLLVIAMTDESSHTIFGLQRLKLDAGLLPAGKCYLPLPGTHGSALQILNTESHFPIGVVGLKLGYRFLDKCNVSLKQPVKGDFTDNKLLDAYCNINLNLPISVNNNNIKVRNVYDIKDGKEEPKTIKHDPHSVKTRMERVDNLIGYTFRDNPFFVNAHHVSLLKNISPNLYKQLLEDPAKRSKNSCKYIMGFLNDLPKLRQLAESFVSNNRVVNLPTNMGNDLPDI